MTTRVRRIAASILMAVGFGAFPVVLAGPARAQSEADSDVAVGVPDGDEYADTDPSALTDFRPTLDPHGRWVDDPSCGTVWVPNADEVGSDFEPYVSSGHWDDGSGDYSWVSDYTWGWVTFHYGRWVWSPAGLWVWIPGRDYAAAWVDWRIGDDAYPYVGWAPMVPLWFWFGGSAVAFGVTPQEPWAFVPRGDLLTPSAPPHAIVGNAAAALVGHTQPYVRATPRVDARPLVQTPMHGPPLAMLGIDPASVPASTPSAREQRARRFARPSTALALGAHAPTPHVVRPAPSVRAVTTRSGSAGASQGRAAPGHR